LKETNYQYFKTRFLSRAGKWISWRSALRSSRMKYCELDCTRKTKSKFLADVGFVYDRSRIKTIVHREMTRGPLCTSLP
jgi:hypothetical protein